jgi:hypothetical protein
MGWNVAMPAKKMRTGLILVLLWASAGEASAACDLHLLNTMPMAVEGDLLTVPAEVNGKIRSFQFDTAAIANQMTDAAAKGLGLSPSGNNGAAAVTGSVGAAMQAGGIMGTSNMIGPAGLEIYDAKGTAYSSTVTVADLTMRSMQNKNVDFYITPLPLPGADGVLNIELFRHFDVDLNFAAGRFNMFSQDHCKGGILYWRAPGVTALPFLTRDNRIVARVALEGKELTAVIDTGSPISALRFDAATRLFGIGRDFPSLTLAGEHHADPRQDLYAYYFKTLSFGTVSIRNPHLMLTGDILVRGANPHPRTGSLIRNDADEVQPDMIIGMDLLKLTHLYLALGERVLYVTQASELAADDAGARPVVPVTPFRP